MSQTDFRVSYGTTQHDSSSGTQPRTIIITGLQDEGQAQDTDKGKAGDTRPGWWAEHEGKRKFFLSERFRWIQGWRTKKRRMAEAAADG